MPKSSRHKSHKQSKHSSRDYSDSEEDVIKMKEKSNKDENSIRVHRDSASGDKRKVSSQAREGKDSKDLSGHGNGDVEEYVSSKRRKEKADVVIGGDRWNGGGEERGDSDRNVEKEVHKGDILKVDHKSKETSSKGESLKIESRSKSKRYDSGIVAERKEDSLASVVVDKEEGKSKGESKRRSGDSSSRKDGKDTKEKDRKSDKEKNGGQESRIADAEVKLVDMDLGKKQVPQLGDFSEDRQGKRARDNTERTLKDELRRPESEKETEKKIRRKKEGSSDREKYYDDSKEADERRLSSKGDRSKEIKYRDDKHKDGGYADKYPEDDHKDERRRDEKYREESGKDNKHQDNKYQEDDEKDVRRRDDRHREDVDRDSRRKDEKHREDGGRESRRKEDKYREVIERESRRDDKYHEDGERDNRRRDDRYHEDGDKDIRRRDDRYHEDGDKDDRRRDSSYRDDGDRDNRHKEEKYREDVERDIRHNDNKQGDGYDREKRPRDSKYRDDRVLRDHSGDKSDLKRSRDDGYVDHHARKSSAYDDSPTHDDRSARYRDDQGRRRINEKEDYGDKSRGTKDQRSDAEKKIASSARNELATDRVRSTSRNADVELSSSHSKRRSSPTSSFHAPRDHYRALKQDESSKYRDHNYEERNRHSVTSSRDYAGAVGGSEKNSSRSGEKLGQKDDGHFGELSAERRLKSDIRSSPLKLVDKSPSSSTDRRQFGRPDVRRGTDVEESIQRSSGSRDWKEFSGKDGRGSREFGMDVFPGEELSQADADNTSSPFVRNSHFSNSSKSLPPPPPYRTGMDSPSMLGSGEDDGRGKPNIRHRRINDPNMGRMQGNAWRGVPSWPSPVANGFLPYTHPHPHPVGFLPFHSPQMFVRPSIDLSHASPFHMPDADRFSGPGRPMGWRNQVDDSCPQLPVWDTSNAVFGDDSHIYGRADWDHSRNLSGNRGWESSVDLWKGQNRTSSMEALSSEKENNSIRSGEGALAVQPVQPAENEQTRAVHQQADSTDIDQSIKSYGKNDVEASLVSPEDGDGDVAKMSRMDDVPLCHVYLSKLDISTDLTEPELFDKCRSLMDVEQGVFSDVDDSKILYMEDVEANMTSSHRLLSYALFASADDSVFQKSMSLYKRQKGEFSAEGGEEPEVLGQLIPNSAQEDEIMEDGTTDKLCPTDAMQSIEDDALPDFDIEINPTNNLQNTEGYAEASEQKIDPPVDHITAKIEEPVSAKDNEENTKGSDTNNEEMKLVDTKFGPLLSTDDVSSEASEAIMMPESIVAGSVNLSRIHHSPESTH